MHQLLERILSRREPPRDSLSLEDFWASCEAARAGCVTSIERAISGASVADRLGFAFVSGYSAALFALVPSLPSHERTCLLATEDKGAHPKNIATSLTRGVDGAWRLTGKKRWATLGSHADQLLVVASRGVTDGKNRLSLVSIGARSAGVTITVMPETPFAPEIPHAEVTLADVLVADADVLEGDGYDRYLKPFRTIEDIHVHAAMLAYVLSVATVHAWPVIDREELVALLHAAASLAAAPPLSPATHVGLAGLLRSTHRVLASVQPLWERVEEPARARWTRDRGLLEVASGARKLRGEAAWKLIEGESRSAAT